MAKAAGRCRDDPNIFVPRLAAAFALGSRSSLPSFPSVQGLFAPGRIGIARVDFQTPTVRASQSAPLADTQRPAPNSQPTTQNCPPLHGPRGKNSFNTSIASGDEAIKSLIASAIGPARACLFTVSIASSLQLPQFLLPLVQRFFGVN